MKIIGAAAAVAALGAGLIASQAHSPRLSPAASKTSAYQQRAASNATSRPKAAASTDAKAASRSAAQQAKSHSHAAASRHPAKAAARPAAKAASKPAAKAASKPVAAKARPACTSAGAGGGLLPQNYAAIVDFLAAHGYTRVAAAGIAGNIFRESLGNPESVGTGGGGLIGWTPLPAGFVTGNVAADLRTQLSALLTYNQQWAQYIPMLNAAKSAAQAAYVYMAYFERPGLPATSQREGAAIAVAQACGIA